MRKTWWAMRSRCGDKSHPDFSNYGGRGIGVCAGWGNFDAFAVDMGERPSGVSSTGRRSAWSIDRINNNGGYWCGKCEECVGLGRQANCRWATVAEQATNRRGTGRSEPRGAYDTSRRPMIGSDDQPIVIGPVMRYISELRRQRLSAEGVA